MVCHRLDLLCLLHLRWDGVTQRPQHLMRQAARHHRVFVVEEPVIVDGPVSLVVRLVEDRIWVVTPQLPTDLPPDAYDAPLAALLDDLCRRYDIVDYVLWYSSPMSIAYTDHLAACAVVYDCMDDLSAFRYASPLVGAREQALLARADLVFTGGQRLYEAKRDRHPRVFCFPSSVDVPHFAQARVHLPEPAGQQGIPGPRLGYSGVIDERMDLDLVAEIATLRPAWQVILLGPVVKLDDHDLPRRSNLHYLGATPYAALPAYLAHWDVALIPFARNAATRFISPTKTPEYLAAGKPVVSTPIHDVVHPYGDLGLVRIAADPAAFVVAAEACLHETGSDWLARVDAYLAGKSWAQTWTAMEALLVDVLQPAAVPILMHTEREVVR